MTRDLISDAFNIIETCIKEMQPGDAVRRALKARAFNGHLYLLAVGKAAWQMADAAYDVLGSSIERGVVITKYGHSRGKIGECDNKDCKDTSGESGNSEVSADNDNLSSSGIVTIYEAGHPIPDGNSYRATEAALEMVGEIGSGDTLILLLSGGGSALFEKPLIPAAEVAEIHVL